MNYKVKEFGIDEYGIEWGYEGKKIVVRTAEDTEEVDSIEEARMICMDIIEATNKW